MEIRSKLAILADAAKYDASCSSSGIQRKNVPGGLGNSEGMGICHSYTPDGRCVSLLKVLLTNFCVFDCTYCINRISSDVKRAKFSVEELVWLTMEFYKRNYIEGLFLSSGVMKTPDQTMEEMIEVARRLRVDHKFQGYIHLKAVAGASAELLQKAGLWADRLSANIELPKQADLDQLAPAKTHEQIESAMDSIATKIEEVKADRKTLKSTPAFAPSGQTTQMIVGATPSTDADILATASHLYKGFSLKRVYYSAFSPIPSGDPRLPLQ
ncbi:MAG TPA: putative DNA modification/repair radical SAM protein, partial [Oligoflexus sp.]|uniref:putative DNA modification/repair radical SAM protein n=1 Tax=Oligoflexus sp. TaxID=1971216 RepID=UPI002D487CF2